MIKIFSLIQLQKITLACLHDELKLSSDMFFVCLFLLCLFRELNNFLTRYFIPWGHIDSIVK